MIGAENICADVKTQAVGFRHILIPSQLVHDLIDNRFDGACRYPYCIFTLVRCQLCDELFRQLFNAFIFQDPFAMRSMSS
jgi:hypothetical protein